MKRLAAAFGVVALVVIGAAALRPEPGVDDFTLYRRAGAAVTARESPYDVTVPGDDHLLYVYPPLTAALLAPLAAMPEPAARLLWGFAGLAALAGSLLLIGRALPDRNNTPVVLSLAVIALFPFLRGNFRAGQVAVVLLFLMLAALLGRRTAGPGAALGAAIAMKLYPAGALLAWVVERRVRAIAWALTVAVLLSVLIPVVVLGPSAAAAGTARFWGEVVPRALGADPAPAWFGTRSVHSHSLPSAIYRWTAPEAADSLRPGTASPLLVALPPSVRIGLTVLLALGAIAITAMALVRVHTFPATAGASLLRCGLVLALLPILGPVSNKAAFTALLPAWAALWGLPSRRTGRLPVVAILAGIGLVLHLFPFRSLFGREIAWTLEAHSDVLIGAICVWLALCLRVLGEKENRDRVPVRNR